jgi:uncharacterized protein (TIGR02145 family)
LLRNHNYNVVIQSVDGEGYPTPGGAFNNKPANIKAEVLPWNDGSIGEVIFDGKNYLGISPGEFTLYRDAMTGNEFTVRTDVAGGWTISGVTDAPGAGGAAVTWIGNVSGSFSGAGNKDVVTFSASENTGGAARVAYIHVKAGRLDFAVKVTQGITRDVRVWITGASDDDEVQELIFTSAAGTPPAAQQFLLHWLPADVAVNVSTSHLGNAFVYASSGSDTPGTGGMTSISDPSGEKLVTIQPPALNPGEITANPFIEKFSRVDFTVFSGGKYTSSGIYLRQVNFHTVTDVATNYRLDGGEHSFTVRSNTAWVISAVSDPQQVLQSPPLLLGQSGGYNTTGETVLFKLATGGPTLTSGTVTLTLTDPTSRVGEVTVTIKGVACGIGGNAVSQRIGNNDYLTHQYGDKCWMVQNSKENPTYAYATRYSSNNNAVNGNYYTWQNAAYGCPEGWHLPTDAEITDLVNRVNTGDASIIKWWTTSGNGAFAGRHNIALDAWNGWGSDGYWWGLQVVSGRYFSSNVNGMYGIQTNIYNDLSVRCVQD